MLECTKCKIEKPYHEFYYESKEQKPKRNGYSHWCKGCKKLASDEYRLKNINKKRTYNTAYNRLKKFGITVAQFDALLLSQDNSCAICKIKFQETNIGRPRLDHDHATGKIRALLCNNCNIGIGMFRDNPDVLREAAKYVEKDFHNFLDTVKGI